MMKCLFVAVLLMLTVVSGFVPYLPVRTTPASSMTVVALHPHQAKELEACAYDLLLKGAMEKAARKAKNNTRKAVSDRESGNAQDLQEALCSSKGPAAWCRRLWQSSRFAMRP